MSLYIGIALALCGAASLSLAIIIQRYSLDQNSGGGGEKIPLCGTALPRFSVWFIGLVIYGIANGFYAFSLSYGPLSLLACIFTTLLVFNLGFARCLIGEKLTKYKICGAIVILTGVVMCVVAQPSEVETSFTPADIEALILRPEGGSYLVSLALSVALSVAGISWFERMYPIGEANRPPAWLDYSMALIYPGSLGLDEGIAHLSMKATVRYLELHQ